MKGGEKSQQIDPLKIFIDNDNNCL